MDPSIERLQSAEECRNFIENVKDRFPELVAPAREKLIGVLAGEHRPTTDFEREAWEVIYAYEEALFRKHGKHVPASYTRRKIRKDGLIAAIEYAVTQSKETAGYTTLKEMGLQRYTWEALVLKHKEHFSPDAVSRSEQRSREWDGI